MSVQKILTFGVLAVMVLCTSIAQAEWNFVWGVNNDDGSPGLVVDELGTALPEESGYIVYLMSAGADNTVDGIDPLTGNILGDDSVVVLFGGGDATAEIGLVNNFLPSPWEIEDGEFEQTSSLLDPLPGNGTVYVMAFNENSIVYTGSGFIDPVDGAFYAGISGTYQITGTGQAYEFPGWGTNTSVVPEPTTIALMIAGLGGVVAYRRKRQTA